MKRKCPKCGKEIEWLEASKEIQGSVELPDEIMKGLSRSESFPFRILSIAPIKWKPEQTGDVIYTCPECLEEIDVETLREWGLA